jgi:prevent-host-death family protein
MGAVQVGARELRHNLREYIDRAYAGEAFEVTDHGKPVCRLLPPEERMSVLDRLVADGRARRATLSWADVPRPIDLGPGLMSTEQAIDEGRRDFDE